MRRGVDPIAKYLANVSLSPHAIYDMLETDYEENADKRTTNRYQFKSTKIELILAHLSREYSKGLPKSMHHFYDNLLRLKARLMCENKLEDLINADMAEGKTNYQSYLEEYRSYFESKELKNEANNFSKYLGISSLGDTATSFIRASTPIARPKINSRIADFKFSEADEKTINQHYDDIMEWYIAQVNTREEKFKNIVRETKELERRGGPLATEIVIEKERQGRWIKFKGDIIYHSCYGRDGRDYSSLFEPDINEHVVKTLCKSMDQAIDKIASAENGNEDAVQEGAPRATEAEEMTTPWQLSPKTAIKYQSEASHMAIFVMKLANLGADDAFNYIKKDESGYFEMYFPDERKNILAKEPVIRDAQACIKLIHQIVEEKKSAKKQILIKELKDVLLTISPEVFDIVHQRIANSDALRRLLSEKVKPDLYNLVKTLVKDKNSSFGLEHIASGTPIGRLFDIHKSRSDEAKPDAPIKKTDTRKKLDKLPPKLETKEEKKSASPRL